MTITGIITICQQPASTLFDLGSIFFYVFVYYVARLGVTPEPLSSFIRVSTPMGNSLVVNRVCRGCVVNQVCFLLYFHGRKSYIEEFSRLFFNVLKIIM